MSGIKRSIAIKAFLQKNTWNDLAELYTAEMEVQVNVAQDGGKRVDKSFQGRNWHAYTDDIQTWAPFRIPRNSMTEPEDNDNTILFDLGLHVEGIGMTGWNWVKRQSIWVAFDFDAIIGHSDKHEKKLSQSELETIKEKVNQIEWVTLRRSTGGSGLHLYVFIDDSAFIINGERLLIKNHNEHMALGRAILSQLSALANFNFETRVDVNAGNMWVWHRKMINPDNSPSKGLELIKAGNKLKSIPSNWQDYVDIIKGRRHRSIPSFIKASEDPEKAFDEFEELSNQRPKIALDNEHRRLLNWIESNINGGSWFDESNWMLVTHTHTLKLAHQALKLKGVFDTVAQGTQQPDWNCYAFPLSNGAWAVRRYTRGVSESLIWSQDGQGWTKCIFNSYPDIKTAAKAMGGVETKTGGFSFAEARTALKASEMLGVHLELHERYHFRQAVLKQHRDKRLIIEIEREKKDSTDDWRGFDGTNNKYWSRIVETKYDSNFNQVSDTLQLDRLVRHIVNEGGADMGWVVKNDGLWREEPLEHVKLILKGEFHFKPIEIDQILGSGAFQPYTVVNRPFDVEYPPGRLWNRKGAKLRFEPSPKEITELKYPNWLKVMTHLGKGLDSFIENNPWAQANNIKNGADYLIIWIAALFQQPYQRLPYLFFYSEEQNTGKSTFHESIALLMDGNPPRGYMKINEALRAQQQFNAELQHAILCVVEELDLNPRRGDAKISYNRIKELVTANMISIHEKRQTPIMVSNTTHFIQASNDKTSCPIFKNDSRITMIRVFPLEEIELIPKMRLLKLLEVEAPDFLAYILRLEIPNSNDRLLVPVIDTEDKYAVQTNNLSPVEQFIEECCFPADGEMVLMSEFYERFSKWMEPTDLERWTRKYTAQHMPDRYPRGRRNTDAQICVGNLSFSSIDQSIIKSRLVLRRDYLVPITGVTNGHKQAENNGNSQDIKS